MLTEDSCAEGTLDCGGSTPPWNNAEDEDKRSGLTPPCNKAKYEGQGGVESPRSKALCALSLMVASPRVMNSRRYPLYRFISSAALVPPKPKELERAYSTSALRALLGT